jgi:hypothetical protein
MVKHESYFTFTEYQADISHGEVRFHYELGLEGKIEEFTEVLSFQPPTVNLSVSEDVTLRRILDSLHILLGISYWKLTCPKDIRTPSQTLSEKQAVFWNTVYTKGLGEFYYRNSIDFRGLVQFPFSNIAVAPPDHKRMKDRSLVLLGSGKDSIVSAELLKKADKIYSLFSMNLKPIHSDTAGLIGKPFFTAKRVLDPILFERNKEKGMYNGHVPITAITSLIGLLLAYLYDFKYVIASNEESANYGNVEYLGAQINHQWSKTYEFEVLFREYIRENISSDLEYFSLLRPLTELAIVKLFVEYTQYFNTFSSCNKNFKILGDRPAALWCGECPKCAFVFLLLATFLPKERVISIFNKNLLDDGKLLSLYKELLGIEGIKPFECVGTPEETLYALSHILEKGDYRDDVIMKALKDDISLLVKKNMMPDATLFGTSKNNCVPAEFVHVLPNI